ncbi:hypothetical protein B4Q13_19430, partial [Lacticaseibacillus rhamnosus]
FENNPGYVTSQNNARQGGSTSGFSNPNNTGGVSGAGEAGGTFARSSDRGYYADTRLYGTLTENDVRKNVRT